MNFKNMNRLIDIYPYNYTITGSGSNRRGEIVKYFNDYFKNNPVILSSARVGIWLALKFFALDRTNHILVSDYTCQSILNILNTASFPVKYLDNRTKAVLLFHQWGYPQEMDKVMPIVKKFNLIVINDCAHSFASKYKGENIANFGNLSVFSLAKNFSTYMGGVFVSKNKSLLKFVDDNLKRADTIYNRLFNRLAYHVYKKNFKKKKPVNLLDVIYLKSINFPNIYKRDTFYFPKNREELDKELKNRKDNYNFIINNIKKDLLIPDLEKNIDVYPLCIPVFLPEEKLERCSNKMLENKIEAPIMHFDINRNIFESDYRKCLAIPCHQQLSKENLLIICSLINQA